MSFLCLCVICALNWLCDVHIFVSTEYFFEFNSIWHCTYTLNTHEIDILIGPFDCPNAFNFKCDSTKLKLKRDSHMFSSSYRYKSILTISHHTPSDKKPNVFFFSNVYMPSQQSIYRNSKKYLICKRAYRDCMWFL